MRLVKIDELAMNEYIKAWECIGCGKIEAPQNCIGICQDRKVELVYAFEHEKALAQLGRARLQLATLSALVQRLAWTKPRADEWEHCYRVLQDQARRILAAIESAAADPKTQIPADEETPAA
jgi:hypothetical protein